MSASPAADTPDGSRPRVVGLTGGVGSGKSTAAAILAEFWATIVDCDQLGREVAQSTGSAFPGIVKRFGPEIVGSDGELDRPALAGIVFNDPDALADLNAITHPAIDGEIRAIIEGANPTDIVVLDMAVLVESDLGAGLYEHVLVIETPRAQRLARLAEQRNMAPADAEARMASQASDSERRAVADHVIVNDGDRSSLERSLRTWWERFTS